MSLSIVYSRAGVGTDAPVVAVETHLVPGLPTFSIVGLAETAVKESRGRVRGAIINSGFKFPLCRITVNLAPADLPKEGGRFDLPIALGILAASSQLQVKDFSDLVFLGELALGGALRPVHGPLVAALSLRNSGKTLVLPEQSAPQAAMVEGVEVRAASCLLQITASLCGGDALPQVTAEKPAAAPVHPDFQDVQGQPFARRALEIAAAGFHSVLMTGPPGTGKTMLACRLPGILPEMTEDDALAAAAVQSLGRDGFNPAHWKRRPFRAPHHTASAAALIGGGSNPRPGEISLAHHGVLFLDELPEFDRKVLETLREPLESGVVNVSRAARQTTFPARFLLVASANPCPCGYLGDASGRCCCSPEQINRYRTRLSGPLLDRIDIHLDVQRIDHRLLRQPAGPAENSTAMRGRVRAAVTLQVNRQGRVNSLLEGGDIDRCCRPCKDGFALIDRAMERFRLSARAYHRILKLGRTIADLEQSPQIAPAHIALAIQLRLLDRSEMQNID